MKHCEKYTVALSTFADGELNDAECAEVLAHLETCESCREFLAELTAMHAAFEDMEEFDAPEGFADSVMARLHEVPAPKKRTHRTAWLSLAACAAIVIFTVGGPLRGQLGMAKSAADCAVTEAAMVTAAEPQECAEEEYPDTFASVQNAPMTMMAMTDNTVSAESKAALGASEYAADEVAELPRSVVFVYGAAREDYLIEEATGFDYYADGTVAGYNLSVEKLDEFLALLDADGLTYDSSVGKQATTFYVQYEEGNTNG